MLTSNPNFSLATSSASLGDLPRPQPIALRRSAGAFVIEPRDSSTTEQTSDARTSSPESTRHPAALDSDSGKGSVSLGIHKAEIKEYLQMIAPFKWDGPQQDAVMRTFFPGTPISANTFRNVVTDYRNAAIEDQARRAKAGLPYCPPPPDARYVAACPPKQGGRIALQKLLDAQHPDIMVDEFVELAHRRHPSFSVGGIRSWMQFLARPHPHPHPRVHLPVAATASALAVPQHDDVEPMDTGMSDDAESDSDSDIDADHLRHLEPLGRPHSDIENESEADDAFEPSFRVRAVPVTLMTRTRSSECSLPSVRDPGASAPDRSTETTAPPSLPRNKRASGYKVKVLNEDYRKQLNLAFRRMPAHWSSTQFQSFLAYINHPLSLIPHSEFARQEKLYRANPTAYAAEAPIDNLPASIDLLATRFRRGPSAKWTCLGNPAIPLNAAGTGAAVADIPMKPVASLYLQRVASSVASSSSSPVGLPATPPITRPTPTPTPMLTPPAMPIDLSTSGTSLRASLPSTMEATFV